MARPGKLVASVAAGNMKPARWNGVCGLALAALVPLAAAQAGRIRPEVDLAYAGAFRLPGPSGGTSWEWGGRRLGHSPGGDPGGAADGFPGSLFGLGHDHLGYVSEISIPAPAVSPTKNVADLPRATTLQAFRYARA